MSVPTGPMTQQVGSPRLMQEPAAPRPSTQSSFKLNSSNTKVFAGPLMQRPFSSMQNLGADFITCLHNWVQFLSWRKIVLFDSSYFWLKLNFFPVKFCVPLRPGRPGGPSEQACFTLMRSSRAVDWLQNHSYRDILVFAFIGLRRFWG